MKVDITEEQLSLLCQCMEMLCQFSSGELAEQLNIHVTPEEKDTLKNLLDYLKGFLAIPS